MLGRSPDSAAPGGTGLTSPRPLTAGPGRGASPSGRTSPGPPASMRAVTGPSNRGRTGTDTARPPAEFYRLPGPDLRPADTIA